MTDIVGEIWARCVPFMVRLTTAEGRVALDNSLRAELAKIEDESLRRNAAELIREMRAVLLAANRRMQ
jgi:hypothetical protein